MFRHEKRKEDEERKMGARPASSLIWCPRPFKVVELDFPNLREILGGKKWEGKEAQARVLYCNRRVDSGPWILGNIGKVKTGN